MPKKQKNTLPEYSIPADLKSVLKNGSKPYAGITEGSQRYLKILQKLNSVDRLELTKENYVSLLKLGLYLEEYQERVEIKKFTLLSHSIKFYPNKKHCYLIAIENLDKEHPLNNACFCLKVTKAQNPIWQKHSLYVQMVTDKNVIVSASARFREEYNPQSKYNIAFEYNNYSFRCSHYALSSIASKSVPALTPYLFPRDVRYDEQGVFIQSAKWLNKDVLENPEQRRAVTSIIGKTSHPSPFILFGPPGTGKTATLVEAISQIFHHTDDNVLVCTHSNAAADVIAKRLLKYIPIVQIDRVYGRSRDLSLIDEELLKCFSYSFEHCVSRYSGKTKKKRIVISTLCTSSRLLFMKLAVTYSYIFIDEAGQATEPDTLIPFNIMFLHGNEKCQMVLAGDPRQLGPCVKSRYAVPILGQSMLERLMKLKPYEKLLDFNLLSKPYYYVEKLIRNYRSHPKIIQVSNELFYDNELIAMKYSRIKSQLFCNDFPIIFHSVYGTEKKEINSTSSYNETELEIVMYYVNLLIGEKIRSKKKISARDIGIITPFTTQSKRLQKEMKKNNLNDVTVGTVEIFQGQEKEIIIISAVRSKVFTHNDRSHIGSLSSPQRFNVAFTRAKTMFIVIGNPTALQTDCNWYHFIKFCVDNNACRGEKFNFQDRTSYFNSEKYLTNKIRQKTSDQIFGDKLNILSIDDGNTFTTSKKNKSSKKDKDSTCSQASPVNCNLREVLMRISRLNLNI